LPPSPAPAKPVECGPTEVFDSLACVDVAGELQGLRVEMPCTRGRKADSCRTLVPREGKAAQLSGKPGQIYEVTVRLRGVLELNTYTGGTGEKTWYTGGSPVDKHANVYQLAISAPWQTYFLNAGEVGPRTWPIDMTRTLRIEGGAAVTLVSDSLDGKLVPNRDEKGFPIVVEQVPPAPAAFDGQFLQIDVLKVKVAPGK